MKKRVIRVIIIVIVLGLFGSCTACNCAPRTRKKTKDYQYIYDVVKDVNMLQVPEGKKDSLLGYGEYMFNSVLLLTPRNTPSTLDEFYYIWIPGWDVDGHGYYFTCKLTSEDFNNFVEGLENFTIQNEGEERRLLKNTEDFSYPAYIVQWIEPGNKWEVLEYILIDETNNTVIYVFNMSNLYGTYEKLEKNSKYEISPHKDKKELLTDDEKNYTGFDWGFSVYSTRNGDETGTYDISFLEYLR